MTAAVVGRAGAASAGAGRATSRSGAGRSIVGAPPAEVEAELARRREAAADAAATRRQQPDDQADDDDDDQADENTPTRSEGRSYSTPEPVSSGAGFVLGVLAWVVARAFIDGGPEQVKKLLRAKFFNQTEGS